MAVAIFIRFTFVGKGNLSLCQREGPFSSDGRINAIHNQGAFIGRAQLAGKGRRSSAENAGVDQLAGDFHTVLHTEPEEILKSLLHHLHAPELMEHDPRRDHIFLTKRVAHIGNKEIISDECIRWSLKRNEKKGRGADRRRVLNYIML